MPTPTDRDLGLRKLSQATRWIAAAGVGLTAILSGVAAHAFSGHTTAANSGAQNGTGSSTDPSAGTSSGAGSSGGYHSGGDDGQSGYSPGYSSPSYSRGGFQSPYTAPQATVRPGRATSGGS